jgi:hypothetical protein
MLQFSISKYQLAMNYQLPITNDGKATAKQFTPLKIENCELLIATQKGVA